MTEAYVTSQKVEEACFKTPLRVQLMDEWENGRPVWRLLSPLVFESFEQQCRITVETGYDTDLASVPRLPVASIAMGLANKAAVIHDALYEFKLLPKDKADLIFLEAMTVDNIPLRHAMYAAVSAFGGAIYNPEFSGW